MFGINFPNFFHFFLAPYKFIRNVLVLSLYQKQLGGEGEGSEGDTKTITNLCAPIYAVYMRT